jgi:uncharacterized protein (DUF924 family)
MTPDAVLDFWFGASTVPRDVWFRKDAAFDAQIAQGFGAAIDAALRGEFDAWAAQPDSALARLLLLDQFTRNAHRDTPLAFAGDAQALAGARAMVAAGFDGALPALRRVFVYLPFEHAEDLAAQQEALRLFKALSVEAPPLADYEEWARKHHAVIARFGRFPHRNALLGRASTPQEILFLREPGSRF